jgi:hypothetical protein
VGIRNGQRKSETFVTEYFFFLGKFHPRSGREGPEGGTGTAVLLSLQSAIPPTTLPRERNPVPVVQGTGWAPAQS